MARRPQTTPRKRPATQAGAAIREAILDAAEAAIESEGMERLTTNHVATRAGVSIGSLYQYFPSKEAIVAELARRVETRTLEHVSRALEGIDALSLDEACGAVIDVLLGGALGRVSTRAALRGAVPTAWTRDQSTEVDARVRALLGDALTRRSDVRQGSLMMIWVVAHAIELVVESAVADAPHLLGEPAFRAELVQLAARYLRA